MAGLEYVTKKALELIHSKELREDISKRKKYWIKIFVEESIKALLLIFNDTNKRKFFLGSNDVVLKVIDTCLDLMPDN